MRTLRPFSDKALISSENCTEFLFDDDAVQDLCAAVRGDCTVWLSKRCHVPKSLALDVLETIIVQYPDIYSGRDGFRELLGVQVRQVSMLAGRHHRTGSVR